MSIRVMVEVWDSAPVSGSDLLLLLALADSANDDGVCWPSQETLSQKTRLNKRHVQRLLKRLADTGILEIVPRFKDSAQSSNSYRIVPPPTTPESSPPRLNRVVPPTTQLSRPPTTQLSRPPHDSAESYRTVIEPSMNRKVEPVPFTSLFEKLVKGQKA